MAYTSYSSLIYYFINNYSYGLWRYSPFHMGSVPSSNGIECMSPSFWFSGTYFGSYPGNTPWYLHSKSCLVGHGAPELPQANEVLLPSKTSFCLYKISWRNSTGFPGVFN